MRRHAQVIHHSTFDATQVKIDIGIAASAWQEFTALADEMARYKLDLKGAELFIQDLMGDKEKSMDEQPDSFARTLRLFEHDGKGHDCPSADHTLLGAVNAVTEYLDHHRKSRSEDNSLDSIWFGEAARIKNRTFEAARILLAA